MRSTILSAFAGLAISATMVQAAPGDPIGSAIAIKNEVTASYEKDLRRLQKDDPVRQEEVIEVGENSLGELKFLDETMLALGPGSRMTLDKFIYDPEKTNGSIIVNLIKGTFRFITGIAAKPTYQIKTPTASISVRGTVFDVYIRPDNSVWLLLIEGAVEVCTEDGTCRVLDEPGKLIEVSADRKVGSPTNYTGLRESKSVTVARAFPFVERAPSFDPDPEFDSEDIFYGNFPRHRRPHHDHPTRGDGNYPPKGDGKPPRGDGDGHKPPPDKKPPIILKEKPPVVRDKPTRYHPPKDKPVEIKKPRHTTNSDGPKIYRKSGSDTKSGGQSGTPKVIIQKQIGNPVGNNNNNNNFGGGGKHGR